MTKSNSTTDTVHTASATAQGLLPCLEEQKQLWGEIREMCSLQLHEALPIPGRCDSREKEHFSAETEHRHPLHGQGLGTPQRIVHCLLLSPHLQLPSPHPGLPDLSSCTPPASPPRPEPLLLFIWTFFRAAQPFSKARARDCAAEH